MREGFPTLNEVECASAYDLMRWVRFLPTASDDEELAVINRAFELWGQLPDGERVAASKAVGW